MNHNRSLMEHTGESTFWYFVGHRVWDTVSVQVDECLKFMNGRAQQLRIPVIWKRDKAIPWCTCCRLFILAKQNAPDMSERHFRALRLGATASIQPRAFFEHALKRILGNVNEPAFPGRALVDSVADTFAMASMEYTLPDDIAETIHPNVLEVVATDEILHNSGLLAVTSEVRFWQESAAEYHRRRPGWFRRVLTNADGWLFNQ